MVLIKRGKLLWAILDRAPTLSQFARMANVSPGMLGGVLRRRRCKMKTLERICAGWAEYSPEDFVDWDATFKEGLA